MTNSVTGHVVKYLTNPRATDGSGVLVIEQGSTKGKATKIAFLAKFDSIRQCQKLKPKDYVQVTYKMQSYVRQNSDNEEYWITMCYVRDVVQLDDKK